MEEPNAPGFICDWVIGGLLESLAKIGIETLDFPCIQKAIVLQSSVLHSTDGLSETVRRSFANRGLTVRQATLEVVGEELEAVRIAQRASVVESLRAQFANPDAQARGYAFRAQRIFFLNPDMGDLTRDLMRQAMSLNQLIVAGDIVVENVLVARERALVSITTTRRPLLFNPRHESSSEHSESSLEEAQAVAESLSFA